MEKKTTSMEFRCDEELRIKVDALSAQDDIKRSDFLRDAVIEKVKRSEDMYESLHKVFGTSPKTVPVSVGQFKIDKHHKFCSD